MINGVLEIVAAVLFAVVALEKEGNPIWLTIAGIYLVCGILNLVVHTIQNFRKRKAAEKAAVEKAAKKAEAAGKAAPAPASVEAAGVKEGEKTDG